MNDQNNTTTDEATQAPSLATSSIDEQTIALAQEFQGRGYVVTGLVMYRPGAKPPVLVLDREVGRGLTEGDFRSLMLDGTTIPIRRDVIQQLQEAAQAAQAQPAAQAPAETLPVDSEGGTHD